MNFSAAASSVLGRQAMRDLDARTISPRPGWPGTPSLELMERAGLAIADVLADSGVHGVELPECPRLLVLAGRGNNGGDGFVVARLLAARGWRCRVALVDGEPTPGADAAVNLERWTAGGGEVLALATSLAELEEGAVRYDLGLDAIFGTGLTRALESPHLGLVENINKMGLPLVSADIPSGLSCDTGYPLGAAIRARATVAIGAAKPGLFLADGPDYAGRVRVAGIGLLPPTPSERAGDVLDANTLAGCWPRLSPLAHKGTRGHVLILAGSRGKTGAAVLAARGALRAGAGLVTVAGVAEVQAAVAHALPEAMTLLLPSAPDGTLAATAADVLSVAMRAADVLVAGPGLGDGEGTDKAVSMALDFPGPLVLDADALNIVATWKPPQRAAVFRRRAQHGAPPAVFTPHPGEMSRLADMPTRRVQESREVVAGNLAKDLSVVVLLKGAATIVTDGRTTAFNLSGNAGMACAGMGDVLAGVCGALLVRLKDSREAACLAAYVHGAAGDHLARTVGVGFLASEVADAIPLALQVCEAR